MNALLSAPLETSLLAAWRRIDPHARAGFFAALLVSVLGFGFEMTNLILHHDDVVQIFIQDTILGFVTLVFGLAVAVDALYSWTRDVAVSGFATTIMTLLIIGSFIMISLGIIGEYIAKAKAKNPRLYRQIVRQYAVWISGLVLLFALSVTMHGWKTGFMVFALAYGLPTLFGPWSMMWFNYMQHVHTDPWSKRNHSRNITGRVFNFLVFNNGLHTVHHDNAGTHWSKAYEAHAKIAHEIHPDLNWRSFWWWIIRGYVIPAFVPSMETKQIGRAPFDPPPNVRPAKRTDDNGTPVIDSVDALEAGSNAQMA